MKNETFFERYMINYFGLGEESRVGAGFEKNRSGRRCCNKCIYCWVGFVNMICKCKGPPRIYELIDYVRTKKKEDVMNRNLSIIKEASLEETKLSYSIEPLLSHPN